MRDLKALDFNLLKALDALLDERNVTRAALRLGVTQPAMSGMLTRLRATFDDPLFVRAQRGMVATARAQQLAAPLKAALAGIEGLLAPATFTPSSARMTFTLAASDYALRAITVPFLAHLKSKAPGIRVALVPVEEDRLQRQLECGDLDLALVTPQSAPADLHARVLFDEHYVCVARQGHPVVDTDRPLTLDAFCALDHALVSYTAGAFEGVTDEALARLGRSRAVSLSVKSFLILPEILRASDRVAVLPSRLVVGLEGLTWVEPPLAVPGFTKVAAWHERTHADPGHRWLRQLLFASCDQVTS